MMVPHAAHTGALIGLLIFALGLNTSLRRVRTGIFKGDGGDEALRRASRAHGLAVEHGVVLVLLLLLLELQGAPAHALFYVGFAIVVARAWAAISMLGLLRAIPGSIPATLTYALELGLPVWLLLIQLHR
jgi:uncharacterized membrane protein YecN with MAPEG domain